MLSSFPTPHFSDAPTPRGRSSPTGSNAFHTPDLHPLGLPPLPPMPVPYDEFEIDTGLPDQLTLADLDAILAGQGVEEHAMLHDPAALPDVWPFALSRPGSPSAGRAWLASRQASRQASRVASRAHSPAPAMDSTARHGPHPSHSRTSEPTEPSRARTPPSRANTLSPVQSPSPTASASPGHASSHRPSPPKDTDHVDPPAAASSSSLRPPPHDAMQVDDLGTLPLPSSQASAPAAPAPVPPAPQHSLPSTHIHSHLPSNGLGPSLVLPPGFSSETQDPLFNAQEKSLLSNFLSELEWAFQPDLPANMPTFSAPPTSVPVTAPSQDTRESGPPTEVKKRRTNQDVTLSQGGTPLLHAPSQATAARDVSMKTSQSNGASEPDDVPTDTRRSSHIMSEQRRRVNIREGFKEVVELLELGRAYGARALGLAAGAGTGVEDEGLDDRSDEDRHVPTSALYAIPEGQGNDGALAGPVDLAALAAVPIPAPAKRNKKRNREEEGTGKGRGRGGSAGGGAGSKSAVLFQAVDFLTWLEGRNALLEHQCEALAALLPQDQQEVPLEHAPR